MSESSSLRSFSRLALDAAAEIDSRIRNPKQSGANIGAFAKQLRSIFPERSAPLLPPETIGLVCDLIEKQWADEVTADLERPSELARQIADKLEAPQLTLKESKMLIELCLSLHDMLRQEPVIHDIPDDHPYILTLA
jgi:hypothetical protein